MSDKEREKHPYVLSRPGHRHRQFPPITKPPQNNVVPPAPPPRRHPPVPRYVSEVPLIPLAPFPDISLPLPQPEQEQEQEQEQELPFGMTQADLELEKEIDSAKFDFFTKLDLIALTPLDSYPFVPHPKNPKETERVIEVVARDFPTIDEITKSCVKLSEVVFRLYQRYGSTNSLPLLDNLVIVIRYRYWEHHKDLGYKMSIPQYKTFTWETVGALLEETQEKQDYYDDNDIVFEVSVIFRHRTTAKVRSGAFLNYYLPLKWYNYIPISLLERYQIPYYRPLNPDSNTQMDDSNYYNNDELVYNRKMCIQYAIDLINSEMNPTKDPNHKYRRVVIPPELYSNDKLPTTNILKLCKLCNITIRLYYIRKGTGIKHEKWGTTIYPTVMNPDHPVYNLALYEKHYFVFDTLIPLPLDRDTTYPKSDFLPSLKRERQTKDQTRKRYTSLKWVKKLIDTILIPIDYRITSEIRPTTDLENIPLINNSEIHHFIKQDVSIIPVSDQDPEELLYAKYANSTSLTTSFIEPYHITKGVPHYIVSLDIEAMSEVDQHIAYFCGVLIRAPVMYFTSHEHEKAPLGTYIPRTESKLSKNGKPYEDMSFLSAPPVIETGYSGITCITDVITYLRNLPVIHYYNQNNEPASGRSIVIYAHNLRYDISFLIKETGIDNWFGTEGQCKGGSVTVEQIEQFKYKTCFVFKDSYAFFQCPLSAFPSMFKFEKDGISDRKLTFPHKFFTIAENFNIYSPTSSTCSVNDLHKHIPNYPLDTLLEDLRLSNALLPDNTVLYWQYAAFYCMIDVKILDKGIHKFRDDVLKMGILNDVPDSKYYPIEANNQIDIHQLYTIGSLAMHAFKRRGCFVGVNSIGGPIREFITQSVRGGRCMTRYNQAHKITEPSVYIDGVSLYPSAMWYLGGYLIGSPKVVPDDWLVEPDISSIMQTSGAFIEIVIVNAPSKILPFPIISYKNEDGVLEYSDICIGKKLVMNKFQLYAIMKYLDMKPHIHFKLLRGYYYNEGRNYALRSTVQKFFELRVILQKQSNTLQLTYKLILNSAYGKTIQGSYNNSLLIKKFKKLSDLHKYIERNDFLISSYYILAQNGVEITDSKTKEITNDIASIVQLCITSVGKVHFNYAHCGSEVLAMSKLIMYEVFNAAENVNAKIYYTDTDSLVMERSKFEEVVKEYEKGHDDPYLDLPRDKRQMLGKGMGMFHPDFEPKPPQYYKLDSFSITDPKDNDVPHSINSIILGRKMVCHHVKYKAHIEHIATYSDTLRTSIEQIMKNNNDSSELRYENDKFISNPTYLYYYHSKMKGIPEMTVKEEAKTRGNAMKLYEDLYDGKHWEADMTAGGNKPSFEFQFSYGVRSRTDFKREVKMLLEQSKEIT